MKKIFTIAVLLFTLSLLSINTYAQREAGGSSGGTATGLIIDLGSAGAITIPTTSPYYSIINSAFTGLNVIITNGVVTFPSSACYQSSLLVLFYTGYINYYTYNTCKPKYSYSKMGCGDDD